MSSESEENKDTKNKEGSSQVIADPYTWLVITITYIQAGEVEWPQTNMTQRPDFCITLANFTVVLLEFCLRWTIIGIDIVGAIQKADSHLCVMRIVQRNKVQMSLSIFTNKQSYPKASTVPWGEQGLNLAMTWRKTCQRNWPCHFMLL